MRLVSAVGAYMSLGVLLLSGLNHLRNADAFREALKKQGLWDGRESMVTNSVALWESLLGVTGAVLLFGLLPHGVLVLACLAAFGTYLAYAAFGAYLVRLRPEAPCACGFKDEPATVWTVFRSGSFALAAIAGALPADQISPWTRNSLDTLILLLAAFALGLLVWSIPAAMAQPYQHIYSLRQLKYIPIETIQ